MNVLFRHLQGRHQEGCLTLPAAKPRDVTRPE